MLAFAGLARADGLTPAPSAAAAEQTAALAALDPTATGDGIRAVVTGLRQTIVDKGLSHALDRASDWVKELELSWTAHRNGHTASGIDTADADPSVDTSAATATLSAQNAAFETHSYALNLGLISFGTGGAESEVWELGHAKPLAALVTTSNVTAPIGEDHGLIANSNPALASHDVELGVRMPLLPWKATVASDHYWWGAPGFGQKIEGTRVGLKLSPVENVEVEGGRAEDRRGNGGFVGLLYRVPLDQAK
ncbi:MAG TPA: hypothetical protein VKV32_08265 [Stellaceae bacterium]|nr:hypothetical protein [Stellaceae bacterium]